jgi:hypothetical protein
MKKQEFKRRYFEMLEELGITETQAVIGAGGAMLMHGLREETSDLDVAIGIRLFMQLQRSGKYTMKTFEVANEPLVPIIELNHCVDLLIDYGDTARELVDGVCCYTLEEILKQKQVMNRPKDQADIEKLKQAIQGKDDGQ